MTPRPRLRILVATLAACAVITPSLIVYWRSSGGPSRDRYESETQLGS